ncbi:hypothetical protein [uncultured Flavonifractor sp.]|uniref:hypothetical protein n=1 Tax=uncultured Flavonifractor sp. TaxID=1193534 RepID=UPI002639B79B|nr:hypothetical protein [uncultured Flavonifractor sp.]
MNISKQAGLDQGLALDQAELELINAVSKKKLAPEEVYAFAVRLCDNQVDRDGERFPVETLEQLAALFVGKCGIFDHQWSARGQTARIYRTELVREEQTLTQAGEPLCYLKGYAYMLRTEGNRELIAEIEGGIKKEVSVGCAVEREMCSICGENIRDKSRCPHERGVRYDGKLCWADLVGATDAYEWSFVAVPAQKEAGVMKSMRQDMQRLEQEAALGRKYLQRLKGEVVRLGGLAELGLERDTLAAIAGRLEEPELEQLRSAFQRQVDKAWGLETQLKAPERPELEQRDGAFLI